MIQMVDDRRKRRTLTAASYATDDDSDASNCDIFESNR